MTKKDREVSETLPSSPRGRRAGLGLLILGLGIGLAGVAAAGRAARPRNTPDVHARAVRQTRNGAALLGMSVLFDSGLEHFRGGFENRAMYLAPSLAATSVAASLAEPRPSPGGRIASVAHFASMATGLLGTIFHCYNITKRPGGVSWNNLFYAAPIGAPGALAIAGGLGIATEVIVSAPADSRRNGRLLSALAALSLAGETLEVALLHFRGAFHNRAMYLPVTLPPLATAVLTALALRPEAVNLRLARALLRAVSALGLLGTGFHIYGVSRHMGGWSNWRQTILAGPPTPAPISFTGLTLAGLAALDLLEDARSNHG